MNYAVRLTDATYQVEMDLYPLPTNLEEVNARIAAVEAFPHTPEEREGILLRIAFAAQKVLTEEEFKERFPTGETIEADPLVIELNDKNYGLVYSAVQHCAELLKPAGEATEAPSETPSAEVLAGILQPAMERLEALVKEKPETKIDQEAIMAKLEELAARPAAPATATEQEIATTAQLEAVKTELTTLQEQFTATEQEVLEAQAEVGSLYWRLLRKPQARGKTQEQIVETLVARGREGLRYLLSDLKEEFAASPEGVAPTLPKLDDPTQPTSPAKPAEVLPESTVTLSTDQPIAEDLRAGELPMDKEEETLLILFPDLRG